MSIAPSPHPTLSTLTESAAGCADGWLSESAACSSSLPTMGDGDVSLPSTAAAGAACAGERSTGTRLRNHSIVSAVIVLALRRTSK